MPVGRPPLPRGEERRANRGEAIEDGEVNLEETRRGYVPNSARTGTAMNSRHRGRSRLIFDENLRRIDTKLPSRA